MVFFHFFLFFFRNSVLPCFPSMTTPLMRSTVFGASASLVFTTTTLVNGPAFPVLYLTLTLPLSFGASGSLGHSGTTQPHDENAEVMSSGASPSLAKKKTCSALPFCMIVSKLNTVS